jgi:predicted permease
MVLGYYLGGFEWFQEKFRTALAKLIMNVALPVAIFTSTVNYVKIDTFFSLSSALLCCVVSLIIGYFIAYGMAKFIKMAPERRGVATMAIMGTNTAFVGIPLAMAISGPSSIPYVLVFLIINNICIFTIGTYFIASANPVPGVPKEQAKKFSLMKFVPAPLWGFIVAIPVILTQISIPTFLLTPINSISSIATPLSLIYIGLTLRDMGLSNIRIDKDVIVVILGRFVMAPAVMAIILVAGAFINIEISQVAKQALIIQAATPTFAVIPIIAQQYRGDVKFATNIVALTSILFIVVVPVLMVFI